MGNETNLGQQRRYQKEPVICCGEQPRKQIIDEASPNVMNVDKPHYGRFSRTKTNSDKVQDNVHLQQTGSTYYKQKDLSIFRRPANALENSTLQNTRNNFRDNQDMSKDSKEFHPLRPITQQQSQIKKAGFTSFKKPAYGAFNANNTAYNTFSPHGSNIKDIRQHARFNLDPKNHKPTPMVDYIGQKQIRHQLREEKQKNHGPFVGQGRYGGRLEQFQNNKRIIMFLEENFIKQPEFKFYDTKDNSSLLNNSTIMVAKKKYGKMQEKYLDQNSNANLKVNQNLQKLQEPIELSFQIDARIVLATCLLIIAIIILVLGATIFYSDVNFFVCLMIAIILYICYLLICYIYNDVLQFLFNVRSFDQFEQDYKKLRETQGELSYHIHVETPTKVIKQCYLLSQLNKYTKIEWLQNQNKDLTMNQLKGKNTQFVFVRFKTKTSFMDPQSQLNTINYFDGFLQQTRNVLDQKHGDKKQTKKSTLRASKTQKNKDLDSRQIYFKRSLKKTVFGYELNPIEGISKKFQQVFDVCYMQDQDSGCFIVLFILFTLFGFCLPFLCCFEAYTKRYRINLLNRFKVSQAKPYK